MPHVALLTSERFLDHDPGVMHPERPQRLEAILNRLDREGLLSEILSIDPSPADQDWLLEVHDAPYVQELEQLQTMAARNRGPVPVDPDTFCGPASIDTAILAAGGALRACDAVMSGEVERAFCALRPPGHHALRSRAMGFCFLNNVAIAARYLQRRHGLSRLLIVDWDVHHGNGTQDTFYEDGDIYYMSIHQYPCYPGTGAASERGAGAGEGRTLNAPTSPGNGDEAYLGIFDERFGPEVEQFRPELILLSAGFDAHRDDPLAQMEITTAGFGEMTARVLVWAREHSEGRLISLLEGGYNLEALAESAQAHLEGLLA
jgi:acetoin utilization deacetylase AcuC-like enzyme